MSRIEKQPVVLPETVEASISDTENLFTLKGPKGELTLDLISDIAVVIEDGAVKVNSNGKTNFSKAAAGTPADAIHALSEGYGFIMSLQVTNDGTGKPYFTNSEVNAMLAKIDNFWTVSSADCTAMADEIKTKMNL